MDQRDELRAGLGVRAPDGRRLGTLVEVSGERLVVERGFLWPRRAVYARGAVDTVRGGEVRLLPGSTSQARGERAAGMHRAGTHGGPGSREARATGETGEELRIPLVREEAVPRVRIRELGAVRVRKVVRTEQRQLTVQVRREELVVERLPPGEVPLARDASGAFEELTQVIPLRREEVEVVRRPVVYEEVHLTKAVQAQPWSEQVALRREVAEVTEERGEARQAPEDRVEREAPPP